MAATLTDGDRLIVALLLTEADASPEDIDDYLEVLAEGVRLGEADVPSHGHGGGWNTRSMLGAGIMANHMRGH